MTTIVPFKPRASVRAPVPEAVFLRDEFFVLSDLRDNARACIELGHLDAARRALAEVERYDCALPPGRDRDTLHLIRDEWLRRLRADVATHDKLLAFGDPRHALPRANTDAP